MKAYITSIGEPTTELSKWSLERLGFDVEVIENQTSLAEKLKYIYNTVTDDFLRVDADVIVNKNVLELVKTPIYWWVQGQNFDWYKQDIGNGGVQFIRKKAIPYLKANIDTFMTAERPESQMFRIDEFNNPRKCITLEKIVCLHGYKQNDIERVKQTKARRKQMRYDFELAERLNSL